MYRSSTDQRSEDRSHLVAVSQNRRHSATIKGKGTMREAFPSLPSGSPELDKTTKHKQKNLSDIISGKDIQSPGSGRGANQQFPSTIPQATTTSSAATTPNKSRKTSTTPTQSTPTKLGHQQSLHNTKYCGTIIKNTGDSQTHSDCRDNISLCQSTVASDASDGMYKRNIKKKSEIRFYVVYFFLPFFFQRFLFFFW